MEFSKKFNAAQSRSIAEDALHKEYCDLIDRVYSEINKEANDGKFHVVVQTPNREECIKKILAKLGKDGYNVQYNNYYNERDCEQVNSITISW